MTMREWREVKHDSFSAALGADITMHGTMVPSWCQISTADEQGSGFHSAGKEAVMPLQVTGFRDPARPAVGCRSHR